MLRKAWKISMISLRMWSWSLLVLQLKMHYIFLNSIDGRIWFYLRSTDFGNEIYLSKIRYKNIFKIHNNISTIGSIETLTISIIQMKLRSKSNIQIAPSPKDCKTKTASHSKRSIQKTHPVKLSETFSTHNLCAEKKTHKIPCTFERVWMSPFFITFFDENRSIVVYCVLSRNYHFSDILFELSLSVFFCETSKQIFCVLNPISMRTQRL